MADVNSSSTGITAARHGHSAWVRISHWIIVVGFLLLAFTGITILMAHPRLYWGEVGNDLTPALLDIPLNNNHRPDEWVPETVFTAMPGAPVSAVRGYEKELFNQNSWGRSLHFLSAWALVTMGAIYVVIGVATGHLRRDLLPRLRELSPGALWRDLREHLWPPANAAVGGPPYGVLQRLAYTGVVFVALPLMLLTGLTMAPAVTASFPSLLDLFGGYQSARTIHFFCFSALILFLVVHVAMVFVSGFGRQLKAMTLGK